MPLLIMCLLVGCVPARDVPPQLSATPAAAYQVTVDGLRTELYSLTPPDGWRIIAGPAEDPFTFQFINPDNTALIVVSDRELTGESLPMPAGLSVDRDQAATTIQSAIAPETGATIYAGAISDSDNLELLATILMHILESLR